MEPEPCASIECSQPIGVCFDLYGGEQVEAGNVWRPNLDGGADSDELLGERQPPGRHDGACFQRPERLRSDGFARRDDPGMAWCRVDLLGPRLFPCGVRAERWTLGPQLLIAAARQQRNAVGDAIRVCSGALARWATSRNRCVIRSDTSSSSRGPP